MLAPDSRTSSAHLAAWSAMNAAKSCADPGWVSALSFIRLACASADVRPWLIAALSLLTTAAGVPRGASTPDQGFSRKLGYPLSIMVGTSGSFDQRCAL